jgi:hypothetical protein
MSFPEGEQICQVYLFERVLLCCKDVLRDNKKSKKTIDPQYEIKVKILCSAISAVEEDIDENFQIFNLRILLNKEETLILKCRNNEQATLWKGRIYACIFSNNRLGPRSSSRIDRPEELGIGRSIKSVHAKGQERSMPAEVFNLGRKSMPASMVPSRKSKTIQARQTRDESNYAGLPERKSSRESHDRNSLIIPPNTPLPDPPSSVPLSTTLFDAPISPLPMPPFSRTSKRSQTPIHIVTNTSLPSRHPEASLPKPPTSPLPEPPVRRKSHVDSNSFEPPYALLPLTPTISNRSSSIKSQASLIKIKIRFGDDIFILAIPSVGAKFEDVLDKVESKIKVCGASLPEGRRVKLRYKDDDGDLISLNCDEDIELAFSVTKKSSGKVSVTIIAE